MNDINPDIAQENIEQNSSNHKLENDNSDMSFKSDDNSELDIEEVYKKAQQEFDDELLEEYDYKLMLQKKFKHISEDPNISKISSINDKIKNKYEIPNFRKFSRDDEKLTQQEILKKDFKDFLILREYSGRTKDYPHSSRISAKYIRKTNKTIKIEDPPKISELDKGMNKASVIFYKNDANQLELIEVACGCGEKVFIELEYDEGKMVSYSPAIAKSEDIDKNIDKEISELANTSSDDSNKDINKEIKDTTVDSVDLVNTEDS